MVAYLDCRSLRYFKLFSVQVSLCVFGIVYAVALVVGFAVYRFWFGFAFDVLAVVLMFTSNLCFFYIGAPCSLGVVDLCCGFVVVW